MEQQQLLNEIQKPYSTIWYRESINGRDGQRIGGPVRVQPNATNKRKGARLDNYFAHYSGEHYYGPMNLAAEGGNQELALMIHHVHNRRAELQRIRESEQHARGKWFAEQQAIATGLTQEEEQMKTLMNEFSAEQLEAARLVCSPTEEEMREQEAQTRDVTKQLNLIPAELESLEAQRRLLLAELEPLQRQVQDLDVKHFGVIKQTLDIRKPQELSRMTKSRYNDDIEPPAVLLHEAQCGLQLALARVLKQRQKIDQTEGSIAEMHQILSIALSYEANR